MNYSNRVSILIAFIACGLNSQLKRENKRNAGLHQQLQQQSLLQSLLSLKQKVDMAVAFLPMLPELQKYCTFSIALDQSELTALMKRPKYSTTGNGLLAPFQQTVWLLVLAAVISMGPIIFIFAKFRLRVYQYTQVY